MGPTGPRVPGHALGVPSWEGSWEKRQSLALRGGDCVLLVYTGGLAPGTSPKGHRTSAATRGREVPAQLSGSGRPARRREALVPSPSPPASASLLHFFVCFSG